MPGRVLNFFEFSDKYSSNDSVERDLQDVTDAASNFADGFDDSTYDQPEIKPNRPVSGEYQATPTAPNGFNPEASKKMNAPEEDDDDDDDTGEEYEESGEEDEDDDENGNPEKSNESRLYARSFKGYLNETYMDYSKDYSDEEDSGMPYTFEPDRLQGIDSYSVEDGDAFGYYPEEDEVCPECGEPYHEDDYGTSCGCSMNVYYPEEDTCPACGEHYHEDEYGSSCGCNM
jgi:hypothetical protein